VSAVSSTTVEQKPHFDRDGGTEHDAVSCLFVAVEPLRASVSG